MSQPPTRLIQQISIGITGAFFLNMQLLSKACPLPPQYFFTVRCVRQAELDSPLQACGSWWCKWTNLLVHLEDKQIDCPDQTLLQTSRNLRTIWMLAEK